MLIGLKQTENGCAIFSVEYGTEGQIDAAVVRYYFPLGKVVVFFIDHGDLKDDVADFIGFSVHKNHIFGCCRSVAESVAEIKSHG